MRTCLNCDTKVDDGLFNYQHSVCLDCASEQRFVMEVTFDTDPNEFVLGFGVLIDTTIEGLIDRYIDSKLKGYDPSLGSCPNLKVKKVEDILYDKDITHIFYKQNKRS